jgi:hypothetical protein
VSKHSTVTNADGRSDRQLSRISDVRGALTAIVPANWRTEILAIWTPTCPPSLLHPGWLQAATLRPSGREVGAGATDPMLRAAACAVGHSDDAELSSIQIGGEAGQGSGPKRLRVTTLTPLSCCSRTSAILCGSLKPDCRVTPQSRPLPVSRVSSARRRIAAATTSSVGSSGPPREVTRT